MKNCSGISILGLSIAIAALLTLKANAIQNVYSCCSLGLTNCCGTCNEPDWECWDAWLACESPPNPPNCAAFPPNYWCIPCLPYGVTTYNFAANYAVLDTNFTHILVGPATGYTSVTSLGTSQAVNFSIGEFTSTNVLAANTATSVVFYAVSAESFSEPTNGVIPWSSIGAGVLNTSNETWQLSWTPPDSQSYVIDADIYDPAVTKGSPWAVTNGLASVLTLVHAAPATPDVITPVLVKRNQFAFRVIGPPTSTYLVQVSTNLETWSTALTITNFSGVEEIVDQSGELSRNFYRAVSKSSAGTLIGDAHPPATTQ